MDSSCRILQSINHHEGEDNKWSNDEEGILTNRVNALRINDLN
jgi:hypothetical protein